MAELSPSEDLQIALLVAQSHQESIRHADAKVGTLVVAQSALVALVGANLEPCRRAWEAGGWPMGAVVTMFVVASLVGGGHAIAALWPRLVRPDVASRFGFPIDSRRCTAPLPADARDQRDDAWGVAQRLAHLAQLKHMRVRHGIAWAVVSALAGLTLLLAAAATGP